jgi:hypothetical protein
MNATTSRGGRYHFSELAEGEYTLIATTAQRSGRIDGIYVAAGHEARVQTAIDFEVHPPAEAAAGQVTNKPPAQSVQSGPSRSLRLAATVKPDTTTAQVDVALAGRDLDLLPLPGNDRSQLEARSATILAALSSALPLLPKLEVLTIQAIVPDLALQPLPLVALPNALLVARPASSGQVAAVESRSLQVSSDSLNAVEIEALPLARRDWQSIVSGVHDAPDQDEHSFPSEMAVSVDGAPIQVAFGTAQGTAVRRSALMGPGSGDAVLRELRTVNEEAGAVSTAGSPIDVETQRGTERLHGQAFLFDRQGMLGARNPFTQWVRETSPASATTVPVFTSEPYSPGDREASWGIGLGGVLDRRLFWFGAIDGSERSDPAVATVKHPDNFFAQPSNDQMLLLSSQLGLSSVDPLGEGLAAYSKLLESLAGLLGPAPRTSSQLTGFGRVDQSIGERNRVTLEGTGAQLDGIGGGLTRASETYGTHSFGSVHTAEQWVLGKWEVFVTPNLLAASQGSFGHQVRGYPAHVPSAFEQAFNISSWGQLPQIVVDSRYGFTIGNPARFGPGSYPDEHLYSAQERVSWVRGSLLLNAGLELNHNTDATSRLRNQTGTYHYATVEDFASDALAFGAFGLSGQLNPMDQHNCDQRGRVWRDTSGVLHGLGYLPCYSWYSQTMGPANWWLSTSDWASYLTSQWEPTKRIALTLAMRWELEQLPAPISRLDNPDLPLTEHLPGLGSQWGPRLGFAWKAGASHWPVVRFGYGMYFARMRNSVVETALTQTGSLKGDLSFFMRPTDNLNAGGAPAFPNVLVSEPANVVKPAAVEFAPNFRNGEIHQAEASIEQSLPGRIRVEASAVVSLGRRLPVTFDANIDQEVNPKTITYG